MGPLRIFFECFVAGEVDFGDYFDNLTSWYVHKDDQNILFLTYESIKIRSLWGDSEYRKIFRPRFFPE